MALVHTAEGPRYSRLSLDALPSARQATLIFDARDVTLIHIKLPPLSAAKLRQALPNAIEDRLLQDPQTCLFALGPTVREDGARLVAVIDRSWLDFVVGAFERRGTRVVRAIPAQLATEFDADTASVVCVQNGLALRTAQNDGLGWAAGEGSADRAESLNSALATVLVPPGQAAEESAEAGQGADIAAELGQARPVGLPAKQLLVHVEDDSWHVAVTDVAERLNLPLEIAPLPLPETSPIDLLAGRQGSSVGRKLADIDWRAWRFPAWLAMGCLAVFLIGLNLHWGKLSAERTELRADMEKRFRETFPQTTAVVDPVLQMEREVARMRAGAGQTGPSDFLPLMTRFAQALGPKATDSLESLEYRDGRLVVNFQPSLVAARSVREDLQEASKRLGLNLKFEPGRNSLAFVSLL
ncbi:MAG: type II secretion system protein GspL [Burkholderiaceae bacterium]